MQEDQPTRVGRRLAAIVAADVAGYSRLMGLDEVGTARTLREHRKVTDALVAKHGGRLVKTTGDGVLLEFPSVVDAVEYAVAVQAVMAERNQGVPEDRRMLFRIGINLGDILIEGDDILGDGVNVAARLEGIAEPGGICVSDDAYRQVRGKVAVDFTDLGEQNLKNIVRPIRAYTVGPSANALQAVSPPCSAPRLSIVVLPFANIGGNPEQEYFVDGVTESLTTDLSRISGAFVIARNIAFTFKGKAVDVKKLGRELNVRYVLEGSVQRGGNRLRVNVQLVDAETGNHVWAERFDKPLADLFDMQDEIVARLANELNAQLIAAEAKRAERSLKPSSLDLYFQGMARWNKGWTPAGMTEARCFFERALQLDPDNVEALVGIAAVDAGSAAFLFVDDPQKHISAAEAALIKALSLASQHARAHLFLGNVYLSSKRAVEGIAECEHALALDPNLADAHGSLGGAKMLVGRAAETEAHVQEALRLSPRDEAARRWMFWAGTAKLHCGADAEAAVWLRRGLKADPNYPFAHYFLAAALANLGKLDDARAAAKAGLGFDPTFTIRRLKSLNFSDNKEFRAGGKRTTRGMRMAGIPEG
jgi:TolB-like protein/class 3 adenylate cyclase